MIVVYALIGLIGLVITYVLVIKIPMDMARRRNRNPVLWGVLSLLTAFPLVILLLWILGPRKAENHSSH